MDFDHFPSLFLFYFNPNSENIWKKLHLSILNDIFVHTWLSRESIKTIKKPNNRIRAASLDLLTDNTKMDRILAVLLF